MQNLIIFKLLPVFLKAKTGFKKKIATVCLRLHITAGQLQRKLQGDNVF